MTVGDVMEEVQHDRVWQEAFAGFRATSPLLPLPGLY